MKSSLESEDDHLIICCDFEKKQLQHPLTGVNKEYFLSLSNFGIKNLKTGRTMMYFYPQNFANKGSNEVNSFLESYIRLNVTPAVKHVVIFLDNSAAQNKNRFFFSLCQHLSNTACESITVHFPMPGHSFMPIDRDFAVLEKKIDRVIKPFDWTVFMKESKIKDPINITFVEHPFTDDLLPDADTPVLRVKNFKQSSAPLLRIRVNSAAIRGIRFTRSLILMTYQNFETGFVDEMQLFKIGVSTGEL